MLDRVNSGGGGIHLRSSTHFGGWMVDGLCVKVAEDG